MNYRALECGSQIRRRFGSLSLVPNCQGIRRRRMQYAIKIILARAASVVDQLRDTETMNYVVTLRLYRAQQWESFGNRSGLRLFLGRRVLRCSCLWLSLGRLFVSNIHRQMKLNRIG